jgi:hypothetical protein
MPASFPDEAFRRFRVVASNFLPQVPKDEYLDDPLERMQHFDLSWRAVRYRYRTCKACDGGLKAMLSEQRDWAMIDDDRNYKLDRCVYEFFTNALSVFESFGLCLYFIGHAVKPTDFPFVGNGNLRAITLDNVCMAFVTAFQHEVITKELEQLRLNKAFRQITQIRNILAHRTAAGRGSGGKIVRHEDGSYTEASVDWLYLPGVDKPLQFDELLFERELNNIGALVNRLAVASVSFIENIQRQRATP